MSANSCKEFISDLGDKLREQFHDNVWSFRCKEVIAMEKTLGISNKIKKTKCTGEPKPRSANIKDLKGKIKDPSIKNNQKTGQTLNTLSVINNKIKLWIQYGKKWMGL